MLGGGLWSAEAAESDLSSNEVNVKLPAELSGRGVEGHIVIRGYGIVPLMAGAGSWRLRNGLK